MGNKKKKKKKKKKPQTYAYFMDIDTAIQFFELCLALNVSQDDVAAKNAILDELMKYNKKMSKFGYDKPVDEVKEHLVEKFGKALDLSSITKSEVDMSTPLCPSCGEPMVLLGKGWACMTRWCADYGAMYGDMEGFDESL